MKIDILISGFGGQGIMSLGKFLSKAFLHENRETIWFPSYGAEMRGGTAHCFVKVSDEFIATPFIDNPDIAIIFNQPSLDKFEKKIKRGGFLILNSDLTEREPYRKDIEKIVVPLNKIALECGNIKTANTVALGILVQKRPQIVKEDTVVEAIKSIFPQGNLLKHNLAAFKKGIEIGKG